MRLDEAVALHEAASASLSRTLQSQMEVEGGEEEEEEEMVPSWRATYDTLVGVLKVDKE